MQQVTLDLSDWGLDLPEVIGFDRDGQPIWSIAGAADDDPDDDDSDDDDDDDDDSDADDADDDDSDNDSDDDSDDDDTEPKGKKRPKPGKKDEDDKAKGPNYDITLRKERMARKKAQRELNALRRKNETDAEKTAREAEEAAAKKYKPVAVKAAAKSALLTAKVKGDPARALRLLDLDELDINEDNDVEGLDDQIDILRAEYPELFMGDDDDDVDEDEDDGDDEPRTRRRKVSKPANRRPAARPDGAGKKPVKKPAPKTSAEKLVRQAGLD
jgi:hypothetical protein